ncbi:MAG: 4-deoxy-4-formamido-L-arabinose-phosphoundecaprenol deformylase [Thioalkalispiraceae bacterium]|jgi:undecaprenyl phosphate-alpha-L-ara4FN deformylase
MTDEVIQVGLRVDVDTFRGTQHGVPQLLRIFSQHNIHASFFFSLGPDNMGRHLWRLLKPAFFLKMLRSKAASLYGWDILLAGTFWPGKKIGRSLASVIQDTFKAGHEVGIHAWDHYKWQTYAETMTDHEIMHELRQAHDTLEKIISSKPSCSAAAGWKCTDRVLANKEAFAFTYNSDSRGQSIFRPVINGQPGSPQIPVTLPTYDELVGRNGVSNENYNETLLALIKPDQLNVLTIHAEVEGIACANLFSEFLRSAFQRNIKFIPLGQLLPEPEQIPAGKIKIDKLPGREGTMCLQDSNP